MVTGASSGIGAAVARRLADEGYAVVGLQRRPPGIRVDFTDPGAVAEAWDRAVATLDGAPDLVVLNAGHSLGGPFHLASDDAVAALVDVLLVSPLLLARRAVAAMIEGGGGHLVLIGSQAALPGARSPNNAVYAACKAGIHALVGPLAAAYGPGVRVNGIAPGDVETPLTEAALVRRSAARQVPIELERAALVDASPLRRLVRPEEVADAVVFLERCAAMSGAVINVSGGSSAH